MIYPPLFLNLLNESYKIKSQSGTSAVEALDRPGYLFNSSVIPGLDLSA